MFNEIASPNMYFYTVDKKVLTNLYNLQEYIKYCSEESYKYHVHDGKNDFASWIEAVFGLKDLSKKISSCSKEESYTLLKNFMENYNSASIAGNDKNNSSSIKEESNVDKNNLSQTVASAALTDINEVTDTSSAVSADPGNKVDSNKIAAANGSFTNGGAANNANNNLSSDSMLSKTSQQGKFHEFSDEELEKFTKFGIKDKISDDEKVNFLKYELNELKNMVKELRKNEKNTLIPELLLRTLDSKIEFYGISKNKDDYERIVSAFNDITREIEYCSQEIPYSFSDDIIKGLELQKITMKKM